MSENNATLLFQPTSHLESSSNPIYIQDDLNTQQAKKIFEKKANPNVINFEIFESSSEEELSQYPCESAAESFQKREKDKVETSDVQEQKLKEKQRKVERKKQEKLKKKKDQERQQRKEQRHLEKKKRAQTVLEYMEEELQDDILQFKDSDRESIISALAESRNKLVDTPTRLINESNEFLTANLKIVMVESPKRKNSENEREQKKK